MTTHFSSTIDAISEVSERINGALRAKTESQSDEQVARVSRIIVRIRDLESRGFIKRQKYSVPTTGDFERKLLCKELSRVKT